MEILLIEDNPADVRLTREALHDAKIRINLRVAGDGVEGLAMMRREGAFAGTPRVDLVLLDLNLPKLGGMEVLESVKNNHDLMHIPVIILTTSQAEEDVLRSYRLQANAYISKPVDFDQFLKVIRTIEEFWLEIVRLP